MNKQEWAQWYDFTGKTAVVTGGTGALGGVMAGALVAFGANVAIVSRSARLSAELRSTLDAGPGQYITLQADVLNREAFAASIQQALATYHQIDMLINGAGGNHPTATTTPDHSFFDLPAESLQWVFDLNIMGTLLPSQIVGQLMAEQGEGVILNISSMNAFRPLTRIPAYSAAKAGISNFTQWLAVHMAQEYSPRIRVNALAPGFFMGNQNRALLLNEDGTLTPRGQQILDHTPMARFGDARELVGTMLWLLSPASEFVTGIVVPVDGGFSAYSGV